MDHNKHTFGHLRLSGVTVQVDEDGWIESDLLRGRLTADAALILADLLTRAADAVPAREVQS